MSLLIPSEPMPRNCGECPLEHWECMLMDLDAEDIYPYYLGEKRHPDCPLIEVPPHGRLIDGDVAVVITFEDSDSEGKDFNDGILYAADWIASQPTVIEAEESE